MLSALMNQIFVVVLLLDEVNVLDGFDVVNFTAALDVQGVVRDFLCILLYDDL